MNENHVVADAKTKAQEAINSIKYLIEKTKTKGYGRLWSRLIEKNPIESALKAIKTYQEIANEYNKQIDVKIFQDMEEAENDLAYFLIANQKEPEVDSVIQEIFQSNKYKYGISILKKIVPVSVNSEKWSIRSLPFPDDILFIIFKESEIKAFGQLMQVSKFFHTFTNNQYWWRMITLKENPKLLQQYFSNIKNHNKIDWKKVSKDVSINIDQFAGKDSCVLHFYLKTDDKLTLDFMDIFPIDLDSNSLTVKNLKKIIVKKFSLKCKPNDVHLIWKTQLLGIPIDDLTKNHLSDHLIIKEIISELPKDPCPNIKNEADKKKNYIYIQAYTDYDPKKFDNSAYVPSEWMIEAVDNKAIEYNNTQK